MTAPRPLPSRRLAAAGAGLVAAAVGVALVVQQGDAACAAAAATRGKATYFDLEGTLPNCSFPEPPADDLFVAMSPTEYATAAPCGTYLDVTGPKGRVRVKVIDSCPPCTPGHIDLSLAAFRRIGEPVQGIIPVTYRTVADPRVPGPLSVRVQDGSSRYWLGVLIDNHANRLTSVSVDGRRAQREDDNYWTLSSGAGGGPFTVTVTDVTGRRFRLPGIRLRPGVTQRTSVSVAVRRLVAKRTTPAATRTASPRPSSPSSPSSSPSSAAPRLESTRAPRLESTSVAPAVPAVDLAAESTTCS